MTDDPGRDIARRDEVLEMLYWIEGEGLGGAATLETIARFLTHPPPEIEQMLADLVARGDAEYLPTLGEYRLTDVGRREAGRRFAEEFAPMLSQGHGECNDPNCDCHSDPLGAAECHARRH